MQKKNGKWSPTGKELPIHVALIGGDGSTWSHKPGFHPSAESQPAEEARVQSETAITGTTQPITVGDGIHVNPGVNGLPDGTVAYGTVTRCYCPPQ